jgi:hypothetical protein
VSLFSLGLEMRGHFGGVKILESDFILNPEAKRKKKSANEE